jgi:ribulose-5-phosphate 4-epimerase/fuculose-1-phosphate aldolase
MLNAAAFMIHSAIHAARPDVLCAAHSHSLYGRAFCSLGRPLDIISQDSCAFHDVSDIPNQPFLWNEKITRSELGPRGI